MVCHVTVGLTFPRVFDVITVDSLRTVALQWMCSFKAPAFYGTLFSGGAI